MHFAIGPWQGRPKPRLSEDEKALTRYLGRRIDFVMNDTNVTYVTPERQAPEQGVSSSAQAAKMIGVSRQGLAMMRQRGQGPAWIQVSEHRVRYEPSAVEAWIDVHRVTPGKER